MLARLPLFVVMVWVSALAMLGPAVLAVWAEDFRTARAFFYATVLFSTVAGLIAIAMNGKRSGNLIRGQLVALLSAYILLPALLALPMAVAVPRMSYMNAWFEMVSAITTTGATIFDSPSQLAPSIHFWRAIVGWLGGLLVWISALAIFAPLAIGGFEVKAGAALRESASFAQISRDTDPGDRLARYARGLTPIYAALTGVLWIGLLIAGEDPFVALCHAMAVLSTSGISPVGGLTAASSGVAGEALILLFLAFGLSRVTFSQSLPGEMRRPLLADKELRLALFLICFVTAVLFLRHFIAAPDPGSPEATFLLSARAVWGSVFTVTSFLTTTGFESREWFAAAEWSGLSSPGLVLLGLAVFGGGIATTAGGVKLLRIYALFQHGKREVERLVHPSSIGGSGSEARHIRREGAQIAWVFFMLFAISIAATMLLLALTGLEFDTAMVLTVSALSTTGPLAEVAAETPVAYAGIPDAAKAILAAAMVVGRLETLAIIALLNPEFWRR